mgnify:CR=1 FL=1
MNIDEFQKYCEAKKGVEATLPFGPDTLVYKVMGKMFALTGLDEVEIFKVNLKCDPEKSIELRERYEEITPGWHMNKLHWNTVIFDGSLSNSLLKELIDHSYELVLKSLSKKDRAIYDTL